MKSEEVEAKPEWTKNSAYEAQALSIGDLAPVAILLVVVVVAVALGAYIVTQIGTNLPANSMGYNVTVKGAQAFQVFSQWFVIIVIVVAAAIIIGLLIHSFYGGAGTGGGGRRV